MKCEIRTVDGINVMAIHGDLTFLYHGDFRQTVKKDIAGAASNKFLLDLTHTGLIDSSGLGTVVAIYKTVRSRNGIFGALIPKKEVGDVFKSVGLTKLFNIYETEQDALDAL